MTSATAISFSPVHPSLCKPSPRIAARRKAKEYKAMTQNDETDWAGCIRRIAEDGDKAAFALLFRHFAPRVKSYLIGRGASDSQAEDAAQEAMATLWHRAAMYDPAKAAASTWIFTIARNKFLDAVRKQARPEPEAMPEEPETSESTEEQVMVSQDQAMLRAALAKLPAKQREMVERAYLGELTHAEISDLTDLPLGTIKSRIRLGLERLRHEIAPSMKDRS